jgi:hypothetical protein
MKTQRLPPILSHLRSARTSFEETPQVFGTPIVYLIYFRKRMYVLQRKLLSRWRKMTVATRLASENLARYVVS